VMNPVKEQSFQRRKHFTLLAAVEFRVDLALRLTARLLLCMTQQRTRNSRMEGHTTCTCSGVFSYHL
jgi:hypothetical protein